MARNVEIKARVPRPDVLHAAAAAASDTAPVVLHQRDVFYHVPQGRLKLRFEGARGGYLVGYARPDAAGPKLSSYDLVPCDDPDALDRCLRARLGVRGEVVKVRTLYLVGQTRVHVDEVAGLGCFMELEVVLTEDQTLEEGTAIARDLAARLGITEADLVARAYMDLLEERAEAPREK